MDASRLAGLSSCRMSIPYRVCKTSPGQGRSASPGQQSGGLLAAGSFSEEPDEPVLMSQHDPYRTRKNRQPGQIAAGGEYWLAGLIAPTDVRPSLLLRTFPYKTALQPLGAPLSDMPRVIGTIPAGLGATDEREAGTCFYDHKGEYVAVLTTWMVRTARGRQSQPQAGWPARAALSTKGRACLVPGPGCQVLAVTL